MGKLLFSFVAVATLATVWGSALTDDLPPRDVKHCHDPNAHYSETDAHNCRNDCDDPKKAELCKKDGPKAGCVCNDGYLMNGRGLCVKVEECSWKFCGLHEVMAKCPNTCNAETCESLKRPVMCTMIFVDPKGCNNFQCICERNHLRDAEGHCVPVEHCPKLECHENESYVTCPSQCPESCSDSLKRIACAPIPQSEMHCRPACRCNNGFWRNSDHKCVAQEQCLKENNSPRLIVK